ncbi:MAG: AMIN domain-containing protein, partial [Candidatus Tectomicrobia bacterium]
MALGLGGCTTPKSQTSVLPAALLTSPVTITAISTQTLSDAVQISVESTGELQYTAFKLQEPPRLVVDLAAAQLAKHLQPLTLTAGIVSGIEPLGLPEQEMVRLLIHLRRMASHSLEVREQQLHITLSEASLPQAQGARPLPIAAAAMPAPTLASPPSTALVPAAPAAVATVVTKVEFTTSPETSVVVVHTSGMQPHIRVKQRKQPLRLSVDVVQARLSPAQDKIMGIHDPGGVVTQLQAIQVTHGNEETVHITVYLRAKTPFEVLQEGNTVRVILAKLPVQSPPPQTTAALVQAAPALATSSPAL